MPPSDPVRLVDEFGVEIGEGNPLPVTAYSVPPGGDPITVTGRAGATARVEPTVTAGAYIAGDCVGGRLAFNNMGPAIGQGGLLTDVIIVDDAGQDSELELWLFNRPFTSPGDNSPWSGVAEDDLEHLVGVVLTSAGSWLAAGTPSAIHLDNVNIRYILPDGTTLYGQLVTRGTPTFAAIDDVSVRVNSLID